jgi:hypothetical protein
MRPPVTISLSARWSCYAKRRRTVRQARDAIADVIEGSHSLHNYPAQLVPLAYGRARRDATDDTGLPLVTFPEACPWPVAQVLDEDFWPEA